VLVAALTRWVLRHKALVVICWLGLTAAGVASAPRAIQAMSSDFGSLPGRPAYEANQQIRRLYGNGGDANPLVLVVRLPDGTTVDTPGVRAELAAAVGRAAQAVGGGRAASYDDGGDRGFVSADGRTTFALLYPPPGPEFPAYAAVLPRLEQALDGTRVGGSPVQVTGTEVLFAQSSEAEGPGVLAETVVGGLGALMVLAVVFGSLLAAVPLVMAAVAIPVTFLAVWGLTAVTEVSFVVQFLVALIGLGVAIDYTLLVVLRWREERAWGVTNEQAVRQAMATAGVAVLVSGTTVAISLAALVLVPVPFLRSMGYGGLLIPLVSVLAALTLLPVLLATVGPRLEWPWRRAGRVLVRGRWDAWAQLVVRRPVPSAAAALLLLGLLLVPVVSLRLAAPAPSSLASSGPARQALDELARSGIGAGALSPIEALLPGDDPSATAARLRAAPGVRVVTAPDHPAWRRDGTSLLTVVPDAPASAPAGQATLEHIQAITGQVPGARVGGTAAQGRDFTAAVYGNAPLLIGLLVLATFGLLVRATRSLLLPLKAILLNALSVAATFGLLVLTWQRGWLSEPAWGIQATGALTEWVPIMVFAFLFGLSMDYEVFILARMREAHDTTSSTTQAAVEGIARTGRLVTSAAMILVLSFVSLAATPGTEVKLFATGMALGILLDATLVRALLVPALVVLVGRWNWWLPIPLARLLRVAPSPRPAAAPPAATGVQPAGSRSRA
jgi:putative drug exporter of the RND superfamily